MTSGNLFPKYDYQINRTFSDRFERQIKRILGELFFVNILNRDTKENTDLMILEAENMDFACRVRKFHYYEKYPDDITIRAVSKNRKETEIHKIAQGFGRYMFYGFCNVEETRIISYRIIDLNIFRYKMITDNKVRQVLFSEAKMNKDGTGFKTFNIPDNSKLIAYSSLNYPETLADF